MAQQPDRSFIRILETEAGKWVEAGIIAAGQKDRIVDRYRGVAAAEDKAGSGRLITTISVIGAVLVGVGVLLFVASNWSQIPSGGKLGTIFAALFASYGMGFYFRYEKQNLPRIGGALILLGALIFGAGIFLVAQMYNITVHYPNGPLLWGLAVLPLAYVAGLNTLLSLAIIDLLLWLGMEVTFSLSFASISGGITVFISLYLLAGITLWVLGLMHRGFPSLARLSGPYLGIGLFLSLLAGYVLTFDFPQWSFGAPVFAPYYYGLAFLFVVGIALFLASGKKGASWQVETVFITALFLLVLILSLTSGGQASNTTPSFASRDDEYSRMRLGFNLLYALQIIGVIVLGYLRRNRAYVNLGLVFFVLEMIARYFDFFWRLLPRSLFFIGGGLLLLAGGVLLEKKRRKVLASFDGGSD